MLEYIYDFLSIFFDKLKEKNKIKQIILFGSFARGNPRKDSDIDLFIDVENKNKEEISELIRESLNEFELKAEKTWALKGINNPIAPIVDDLDIERWRELRQDIESYGKILYGNYQRKKTEKNKVLITYDISRLKQKDKMNIIRKLQGYKLKRGKKIYEQKGLIEEAKAEKLSNAILIDKEHYKKIIDILRSKKVPLKIIEL